MTLVTAPSDKSNELFLACQNHWWSSITTLVVLASCQKLPTFLLVVQLSVIINHDFGCTGLITKVTNFSSHGLDHAHSVACATATNRKRKKQNMWAFVAMVTLNVPCCAGGKPRLWHEQWQRQQIVNVVDPCLEKLLRGPCGARAQFFSNGSERPGPRPPTSGWS